MPYKIFVDGQEGTTGLEIHERLAARNDLQILKINPEKRKDNVARKAILNEADLAFLCLPDTAAKEAVALVENNKTRIIDASTAHRTNPDWAYGIPELAKGQREKIKNSKRVTVPGCYATGFVMALYPLIQANVVQKDYPVTVHAVSGYSGGGKKLIFLFEDPANKEKLQSPCFYALTLSHKHIPEMQKACDLEYPPLFSPIVANYYRGMTVAVPLFIRMLPEKMPGKEIRDYLADYYAGEKFVEVKPYIPEYPAGNGYFTETDCNFTNRIEIYVFGNSEQVLLLSRLDNLGKGASGAAVQNMNIILGLKEETGL